MMNTMILDSLTTTTTNPLLALLKNKTLTNPETWKKLQNLVNLLAGIAPMLIVFFPSYRAFLTPDFITQLGIAVATINAYLTTATTGKIGL